MDVRLTFSNTSMTPACFHSPETSPLLTAHGAAACQDAELRIQLFPTSLFCILHLCNPPPAESGSSFHPAGHSREGTAGPEPPRPNPPGPAADAGCWMCRMLQVSKCRFPLSPTVVLSLRKVGNDQLPVSPIAVYCSFHSLQLVSLLSDAARFS